MPFINFFAIQTPPYMQSNYRYSEKIQFPDDEQKILTRTRVVELTPQQKLHARCKVRARVLCDGREYGSREFLTNDNGEVDLAEFLRGCVKAAPLGSQSFKLELHLYDDTDKELLARNVDFAPEHVMSRAAANDLAAYRSGDTDCLNRLLLSRRSHLEWRKEAFDDDLAITKNKPDKQ